MKRYNRERYERRLIEYCQNKTLERLVDENCGLDLKGKKYRLRIFREPVSPNYPLMIAVGDYSKYPVVGYIRECGMFLSTRNRRLLSQLEWMIYEEIRKEMC